MKINNIQKKFFQNLLNVLIPIIIQMSVFNLSDIFDMIIVGKFNDFTINGFFISRKIIAIDLTIICALCAGAAIFFAQVKKNNIKLLDNILLKSALIILLINFIFLLIIKLYGRNIICFSTNDNNVIEVGCTYLSKICITLIPNSFSILFGQFFQCKGYIKHSLVINAIGTILNILLNYCLGFGYLFFPKLGYMGVIYATIFTRLLTFFLLFILFLYVHNKIKGEQQEFVLEKIDNNIFLKTIFPIILQNAFWFISSALYTILYGKLGTEILSAYSTFLTIAGIYEIFLNSNATAASIVLGNLQGEDKKDELYAFAKFFLSFTIFISILSIILIIIFKSSIISYFNISINAKASLWNLLFIGNLFMIPKALNILFGAGIFRSGGDTKIPMILDFVGCWIYSLPLVLFFVTKTNLKIEFIVLLSSFEEIFKMCIFIRKFLQKTWIKKLV